MADSGASLVVRDQCLKQKNLGRGELGHGLGALRDGVLGELSGEDQAHGGLDLPGGDRRLLVVARELGGLGGDLKESWSGGWEEARERERASELRLFRRRVFLPLLFENGGGANRENAAMDPMRARALSPSAFPSLNPRGAFPLSSACSPSRRCR